MDTKKWGIIQSYRNKVMRVYRTEGRYTLVKMALQRFTDLLTPRYILVAFIYSIILRIADRSDLPKVSNRTFYYSESDKINYENPIYSDPIPREFSHIFGNYEFEKPLVCEIKNGVMLEKTGIRTTNEFTILLETVSGRRDKLEEYFGDNIFYLLKLVVLQFLSSKKEMSDEYDFDSACPLLSIEPYGEGPGGFAGWVQDSLTKLEGLEYYIKKTGEKPTIILEQDPPEYQINSLKALGYSEEDYTTWNGREIKIKKLIVPSSRRPENNTSYYRHRLIREYNREYVSISPAACKWLRSTAIDRVSTEGKNNFSKKILISRNDAQRRRIINEEELMEVLAPQGFERYELSTLTFQETIQMFSNASMVVAPHGAGLVSTVFSEDCDIIEIFGYNIRPIFFMLSQNLGNNYGLVICEPVGRDIHVDVEKVSKFINRLEYAG